MIISKRVRIFDAVRDSRLKITFAIVYPVLLYLVSRFVVDWHHVPLAVPALLGTLLSILLGFRTNAAYQRWWEARKVWGAIVNDSRSWARQVLGFLGCTGEGSSSPEEIRSLQEELVYRQMGWNYALGRSLRGQAPLEALAPFVPEPEIAALRDQANVPNAMLETQGRRLRAARERGDIDGFAHLEMDQTLTRLCDSMGKCERIKNTVFPTPYTYQITLAIWIFVILIPDALVPYMGWLTMPAAFVLGGVFISIESISRLLQDPFENCDTDTPMTALSRTIEINLRQQLGESEVPPPLKPVDGVLM